jgi:alkylation response protein AidB-like acyl-CoA dehydrogenase
MDVRYSSEQEALRDAATRLIDRLGPHSAGEVGEPERSEKLDAAVAASGWRELRTDRGDGSPLASGVEAGIVAEALGRGLADTPFFGPVMAGELRRLNGAPPGRPGETLAFSADLSSALFEEESETRSGVAVDAGGSSTVLLLVAGSGGPRLLESTLSGHIAGVDPTRPSIAVPSVGALQPVDGADRSMTSDDLDRFVAFGLALACADLVGSMSGAVELAVDYARDRHQYGAAIGSFQAVQHMLADAYVLTEGARSVALHASWAVDELSPADALAACSVAKAYCARAAMQVCETAIQVHGGIGNTWECSAHLFLRRALLSGDLFGNTGVSLARVLAHQGIGGGDGLS